MVSLAVKKDTMEAALVPTMYKLFLEIVPIFIF